MKRTFTIIMLSLLITSASAQQFYDIPWWPNNGDAESTNPVDYGADSIVVKMNGFSMILPGAWFTQPVKPFVDWSTTGLAPGEGVDGSQAVAIGVKPGAPGSWTIQMRTEAIDIFPSGEGEYIFNWSVKSRVEATKHPFYHVVALFDEDWGWLGGANEIKLDTVLTTQQLENLHTEYAVLSDTVFIPATAVNNNGETKNVRYVTFAAQCANTDVENTFYWDNFSVLGPESFYDLTFEVYTIVDTDTAAAEGATVMFGDNTYTTDAAGMTLVESVTGDKSHLWTVSLDGFATQSNVKRPTFDETIKIYLEEEIIMSTEPEMIATMVYPNPAKNTVRIESSSASIREVGLVSITGSVITKKTVNAMSYNLDVSSYQPGLYFLKVVNENNETYSQQLIVTDN